MSLDHIYTSRDANSLWGVGYKSEQKTVGFVSIFDKNLIQLAGVQNATDSTKVFIHGSLVILEENGKWHQEVMSKVASLEAKVAKWMVTTHIAWKVECP